MGNERKPQMLEEALIRLQADLEEAAGEVPGRLPEVSETERQCLLSMVDDIGSKVDEVRLRLLAFPEANESNLLLGVEQVEVDIRKLRARLCLYEFRHLTRQ